MTHAGCRFAPSDVHLSWPEMKIWFKCHIYSVRTSHNNTRPQHVAQIYRTLHFRQMSPSAPVSSPVTVSAESMSNKTELANTNSHTHARTYARTQVRTHTLTHSHTHARTHSLAGTHARSMHPHTRSRTHTRTHAITHERTHTHTQDCGDIFVACPISVCFKLPWHFSSEDDIWKFLWPVSNLSQTVTNRTGRVTTCTHRCTDVQFPCFEGIFFSS